MSSCCHQPEPEDPSCCGSKRRIDLIFWGSLIIVIAAYIGHLTAHDQLVPHPRLFSFTHGVFELMNKMWWGLLVGIAALAFLTAVPREFVASVLGKGGSISGLFRATGAGLLLDLCNHGILMVGMKLYERGASLGQVFAFLIASPWNSLSLTLILVALIGIKWTLIILILSAVVALITGFIADRLVAAGILPKNPNAQDLPEGFSFFPEAKARWRATKLTRSFLTTTLLTALRESRMIIRWILFGAVMAAALRALVPLEAFGHWFGPSLLGLALTFVAATIIEVCSEGSSPIAADLITRADAPGNGFAFLMAGASTDYTEIMALKETTRSWKATLALPLLTSPQILLIAWILNQTNV
ncbi:MAG: permease [Akkermansiaceae bacterium]|nr:permease [Akkermansiaceae bacterium]